jgi:hypothetical protein
MIDEDDGDILGIEVAHNGVCNSCGRLATLCHCHMVGRNMSQPIKDVMHSELERVGDSLYKSECPECKIGILLVNRDQRTFELLEYDRCVLCGQAYRYLDIDNLRRNCG